MAYGRLDVYWPEGKIESFLLDNDTVSVGRAGGNTIMLETDSISRYHLSITRELQKVFVTDLDSQNGTYIDGIQLASNEPYMLTDVEEIIIGHLRLIYTPLDESPTLPVTPIEDDTQQVEQMVNCRVEFDRLDMDVWPASNTTIELYITNTSDEDEDYIISIEGEIAEWVRINRPRVSLGPDESAQVLLNAKPPRRSNTPIGEFHPQVIVSLKEDPDIFVRSTLTVRVHGFYGFGMALTTDHVESSEPFALYLLNQGNLPMPVSLHGSDPDGALHFSLPENVITLKPGQRFAVSARIHPSRTYWIGSARQSRFNLVARSHTPVAFSVPVEGSVTINPRIPGWALITAAGITFALIIGFMTGMLTPKPDPRIVSFALSSNEVMQGTPITLEWSAENTESFNIRINGGLLESNISGDVTRYEFSTTELSGSVDILLEAVSGDVIHSAGQTISIYVPMSINSFVVEPAQLIRNVESSLTLSWDVSQAERVYITGLDAFVPGQVDGDHLVVDSIVRTGMTAQTFTVLLHAVDALGNEITDSRTVGIIIPECIALRDGTALRAGPHPLHQIVATIPTNSAQNVIARSNDGQWLQFELTGNVKVWGAVSDFTCEGVPLNLLRIESEVPPVPTLTPTFTPSTVPTASPTTPPTPVPAATATLQGS